MSVVFSVEVFFVGFVRVCVRACELPFFLFVSSPRERVREREGRRLLGSDGGCEQKHKGTRFKLFSSSFLAGVNERVVFFPSLFSSFFFVTSSKMSGVRQVIGKVKNRAPAPIQITAEQILTEAKARQDDQFKEPKQHISDAEELAMHKLSKRKEFEDSIRRQRMHIGTWVKYAQWEASHHDFERARSVFERALDVDEYNTTLWFAYADMEMKNECINHARNVWDRAVALLPRVDQLWYRYTYMEDMIGNVKGCRGVFERWMRWEPNAKAWATYVNFEERGNNLELARKVYERYSVCHPVERTYIRFAKWEERHQQMTRARGVYEKALKDLPAEEESTAIYIAFAKFEERCHE